MLKVYCYNRSSVNTWCIDLKRGHYCEFKCGTAAWAGLAGPPALGSTPTGSVGYIKHR